MFDLFKLSRIWRNIQINFFPFNFELSIPNATNKKKKKQNSISTQWNMIQCSNLKTMAFFEGDFKFMFFHPIKMCACCMRDSYGNDNDLSIFK